MSRIQKVERLFYIITYLNNHDTVTAEELAKNCQTSVRSIYRDMKVLDEMGFYYLNEGKKGYRLIHQPVRPNFNLKYEEWLAITLFPLLSENIAVSSHPFHYAYKTGLEKIRNSVRDQKAISISAELGDRILFQNHYRDSFQHDLMPLIIEAIVENKSIKVTYYSIYRNETSNRLLDPYYLIPRGGHLYLVAYCHKRKKIQVFRISRFENVELTHENFKIQKGFKINEYLKNRWSIFGQEDTEPINFVVKFQKEVTRYVLEFEFYADTILDEQEDGSLVLRTQIKGKEEFLTWIRSFGTKAEVLEPREIRKQLRAEYKNMFEMY